MEEQQQISPEAIDAICAELGKKTLLLTEANVRIAKLARRVAELEAPKGLAPLVGLPGRGKGQKPSEQTDDAPAAPTA